MPTPLIAFRCPTKERVALVEMAKLYGAPNVSAFLRDMVGAMCGGNPERAKAFNGRLIAKMGEQLTLNLNAQIDGAFSKGAAAAKAIRVPLRANSGRKKARGRRGH